MKNTGSGVINTIASLMPALIQVFAFFAIEFSNLFRLNSILLNPESLTVINFIALIFSISAIGIYTFWKTNYYTLVVDESASNTTSDKTINGAIDQKFFFEEPKITFRILKIMITILFNSLLIFLSIVIFKGSIPANYLLLGIYLQWISYLFFISSLTLIIYIWLEDYRKKNNFSEEREIFLARVLEKLREIGWLTNAKVYLMMPAQNNTKLIVVEIEGKFLEISSSYDGREIIRVTEYKDNPLVQQVSKT